MQSGESIYNLIPPPEVQQARPPMHKSQHPGTVDPAKFGLGPRRATATFGRAPGDVKPETSKFLKKNTGVLNATANTRASPPERLSRADAFRVPHELRAATENTRDVPKPAPPHSGSIAFPSRPTTNASLRAKRARFSSRPPSAVVVADSARRVARGTSSTRAVADPDPTPPPARKFSVDSSSSASKNKLSPFPKSFFPPRSATVSDSFERRARVTTKPPVPKATERPLMGLRSTKNFIAANAIETILAKPPTRREPAPATSKKDYGRVPDYLRSIKAQIEKEKAQMEAYEREQQDSTRGSARQMTEDERDELLYELKMKWAKLNKAYGGLSFSLDVPSHQRRKESLEKEMTQLEKDIKSLQGKQVVVVEEHAGHGRA
jgi:hypothetical protein